MRESIARRSAWRSLGEVIVALVCFSLCAIECIISRPNDVFSFLGYFNTKKRAQKEAILSIAIDKMRISVSRCMFLVENGHLILGNKPSTNL